MGETYGRQECVPAHPGPGEGTYGRIPSREQVEDPLARRLGALEEELGEAEPPQASLGLDLEDRPSAGILDLELLPGVPIDEGLNAQIVVRIVVLEEQPRHVEGGILFLLVVVVGPTRSSQAECDRRRQQEREQHARVYSLAANARRSCLQAGEGGPDVRGDEAQLTAP